MVERNYPGKIILFGEYTVIIGGEVLAIPTSSMGARWRYDSRNKIKDHTLMAFAKYLNALELSVLNNQQFLEDIQNGLILQSDIPRGYGCGSSGALVAAVFDRYNLHKGHFSLEELKNTFGQMESFFHGNSSGIDPLVSFFNRPMRIGKNGIEILDNDIQGLLKNFYLADSGKPKNTAEYVKIFKEKMLNEAYAKNINKLSEAVVKAIESMVVESDGSALSGMINEISEFQWKYFSPMIPPTIKSLWKSSFDHSYYSIKLCGSGGGGYFLVYTEDPDKLGFDVLPI